MMRYFKKSMVFGFAVLGLATLQTQAAVVLFQDSFDAEGANSVLNFSSFANWTVGNGTVDYIRNGDYGISCFGGSSGCVDLDGSTGNGGRMTSKAAFSIVAGETYSLSVQVSGNQRFGAADDIEIGLVGSLSQVAFGIAPGSPFGRRSLAVSGLSGTFQLFMETSSADNVGVIVDDVTFSCVSCQPAGSVPEPGALALLGLGLWGVSLARRRG